MTEEELQELSALREEKRQRQQELRAGGILEAADIPSAFAALLTGADDEETDRKAAAFCEAYQRERTEDIQKRLPPAAPVVTAPVLQRAKRGIQRIH